MTHEAEWLGTSARIGLRKSLMKNFVRRVMMMMTHVVQLFRFAASCTRI